MLLCERGLGSAIPSINQKVRERPIVTKKKNGGIYLIVGSAKGPRFRRLTEAGWDTVRAWYPFDSYPAIADIPIKYEDYWELQRCGHIVMRTRRTCGQCKSKLRQGVRFCHNCGAEDGAVSSNSKESSEISCKQTTPSRRSLWKLFLLLQIIVIPAYVWLSLKFRS